MKKFLPLVLVLTFLLTGCRQKEVPLVQPVQPVPTTLGATSVTTAVTQTIITPLETIEDGQQEVKADESALDLLKRTHTVELKHYSFGDVADSVDGVKGGTDGRYWIFYVNGKMSELGAGEYKIKNGDQIVWKFQKENESL